MAALNTTTITAAGAETINPSAAPEVKVKSLESKETQAWDEFVHRHPEGTFFHLTGWMRVIEKTFGYYPRYLYAARGAKITGVLPLFETSSWLQGKCLVSTPMAVYGGICAEDDESQRLLLDEAKRLAQKTGVQHLEMRERQGKLQPEFHPNTLYTAFYCELKQDPASLLKGLPRDTRYMIRKAQKNGLVVESGLQHIYAFHHLFAQSMRRLGTPAFPIQLFKNLADEFKTSSDILLLSSKGSPVAAVFSFFFRDTVLPYYAGASPEAPALAANNLLYWELMERSALKGIRWFDFGRSKKGTGAYAFKTQWNMTALPLNYQIYLVRRETVPNFTPLNPKFERAARVWSKLPLALTKMLGPHVVRWFP